jgi:hypothetical protein
MPGERERTARGGLWSRAGSLAAQAPARRNRYEDFLRAVSITVVVLGHWLMAAPYYAEGALQIGDLRRVVPWTRWLTWAFQVMPVFFMVGGYANAASWASARRSGRTYAEWVAVRLRRLVAPLVLLLLFWTLLAAAGHQAGVQPVNIRLGSQAALIPVWFLSVYVLVVVAVPVSHRVWRRFGLASFRVLALGLFHAGLLLGLQGPMRRWLERSGPWTFTVLLNGYIMTLYLWHLTAMVLVIGAANLLGGAGLGWFPGNGPWWATRPLWDLFLGLVLWPFLAVFARFELGARRGRLGHPLLRAGQPGARWHRRRRAAGPAPVGGDPDPGGRGAGTGPLALRLSGGYRPAILSRGPRRGRGWSPRSAPPAHGASVSGWA